MGFPTTPILDNFNRDNEGPPPSASWFNETSGFLGGLEVLNNQCVPDSLGSADAAVAYWDDFTVGPDCENYVTVVTRPADGDKVGLGIRQTTGNATTSDGYNASFHRDDAGGDYCDIEEILNGGITKLGDSISFTFADGDKVGIKVVGTTITAWHNPGTGWVELGSRTDATYADAGYLTLMTDSLTIVCDDFGGGDYAPIKVNGVTEPAKVLGVSNPAKVNGV